MESSSGEAGTAMVELVGTRKMLVEVELLAFMTKEELLAASVESMRVASVAPATPSVELTVGLTMLRTPSTPLIIPLPSRF